MFPLETGALTHSQNEREAQASMLQQGQLPKQWRQLRHKLNQKLAAKLSGYRRLSGALQSNKSRATNLLSRIKSLLPISRAPLGGTAASCARATYSAPDKVARRERG